MTFTERKEKLADQIRSIENKEVVSFLEEELSYLLGQKDILDDLSPEFLQELKEQMEEPWDKDILSEEDFLKVTERWRSK